MTNLVIDVPRTEGSSITNTTPGQQFGSVDVPLWYQHLHTENGFVIVTKQNYKYDYSQRHNLVNLTEF